MRRNHRENSIGLETILAVQKTELSHSALRNALSQLPPADIVPPFASVQGTAVCGCSKIFVRHRRQFRKAPFRSVLYTFLLLVVDRPLASVLSLVAHLFSACHSTDTLLCSPRRCVHPVVGIHAGTRVALGVAVRRVTRAYTILPLDHHESHDGARCRVQDRCGQLFPDQNPAHRLGDACGKWA